MSASNGAICEPNKNREASRRLLSTSVWAENPCWSPCDNEDHGLANGCGLGIPSEEGGRAGLSIGPPAGPASPERAYPGTGRCSVMRFSAGESLPRSGWRFASPSKFFEKLAEGGFANGHVGQGIAQIEIRHVLLVRRHLAPGRRAGAGRGVGETNGWGHVD